MAGGEIMREGLGIDADEIGKRKDLAANQADRTAHNTMAPKRLAKPVAEFGRFFCDIGAKGNTNTSNCCACLLYTSRCV